MTAEYTEFFKAASPLRGGKPGGAMGAGTWGATAAADSILVSTTLTSCVIFIAQTYGSPFASGAITAYISSNGMAAITATVASSGSWIAIGY